MWIREKSTGDQKSASTYTGNWSPSSVADERSRGRKTAWSSYTMRSTVGSFMGGKWYHNRVRWQEPSKTKSVSMLASHAKARKRARHMQQLGRQGSTGSGKWTVGRGCEGQSSIKRQNSTPLQVFGQKLGEWTASSKTEFLRSTPSKWANGTRTDCGIAQTQCIGYPHKGKRGTGNDSHRSQWPVMDTNVHRGWVQCKAKQMTLCRAQHGTGEPASR